MENQGNGNQNEVVNAQFGQQEVSSADAIKEILNQQDANQIEQESQAEQVEENESETQETNESDEFNKKFAALSRKEREIRERESQLEEKLALMEAKLEALQAPQVEEPEAEPELPLEYRLKKNPIKALEEMGLSYDKLTELVLNDGKLPADMQLQLMREEIQKDYQSKIEELENRLIEKEKSEEEERLNSVVNNFKSEINQFVDSNKSDYELISLTESQDLVYDVISEHYEETGRILEIAEAAEAVEEHLVEEAKKVTRAEKLAAKAAEQKPAESQRQSQTTLSNAHSAVASTPAESKLSDEESKQRIAQMLKWTE